MKDTTRTVIDLCDRGETVQAMIAATGLSRHRVYAILRQHRPNRPRQARRRVSPVPGQILAMRDRGIEARQIAHTLDISRQYVYQVFSEVDGKQNR